MVGHQFNETNPSPPLRIRDELKARIELGEWVSGARQPTVRQLAQEYHASTATIQLALQSLCEVGDIEARGGTRKRYHVGGSDSGSTTFPLREKTLSRSSQLLTALREDLLSGEILDQDNRVFPTKLLVTRYGTTSQTLLAVQRRLADDGLIRRYGRRWILNDSQHTHSSMFFNLVLRPGQFAPPTKPFESVFGSLEYELHRAGLKNRRPVVTYSPDPSALQPLLRSSAAFFHCHSADFDFWMNYYANIGNIPVIYLNVSPSEMSRPLPAHHSLVHIDEHAAGMAVGQYLAREEHSHIAFFYPKALETEPWLRERVEGLGRYFSSSTTELNSRQMQFHPLQSDEPRSDLRIETSTLRQLGSIMNNYYPPEVRSHFLRPLWETRNTIPVAGNLLEMLDSVYNDRAITAWVFANDRLAFTGYHYLTGASRRIQKPFLVGFDNSPVSAQLGLTSYDFGIPQLCRLAVQAYLRPVDIRRTYGRKIALQGTLMVRESGIQ